MAGENVIFTLQSSTVGPPANWLGLRVKMVWNDNVQPKIIFPDLHEYVNEHIPIIQNHLDNIGHYDGLQYSMSLDDGSGQILDFLAYLDCTKIKYASPVKWRANVVYLYDLDDWAKKFQSISFGYLAQAKGMFGNNDYVKVPVVIHKKFDALEVSLATLGLYVIIKDISEAVKHTAELIGDASTTAAFSTGAGGALLRVILKGLYQLAYYALMTIALKSFSDTINKNLLPRKVHYKGIRLKTLVSKVCEHFGLTLETDIDEMYKYVYLPSKTDEKIKGNRKDEGIPNISDFGYQCSEIIELVKKLFDASVEINGDKMYIYNQHSQHWKDRSNNIMPSSIEMEEYHENADEMIANTVISFQYDPSDDWTMPGTNRQGDYTKGTNFQVIRDFDNGGDERTKLNKGLLDIQIPLALGKRRDKLSFAEEALKIMFKAGDELSKAFGGQSRGDKIDINKGCLQISQNSFNTAKLIYIDDSGYIPANHRDKLSARALYDGFYVNGSFIKNPSQTQHKVFEGKKIPFTMINFFKHLNSPYFTIDQDNSGFGGKEGKLTEIEWNLGGDSAVASYYIESEWNKTKLSEDGNNRIES